MFVLNKIMSTLQIFRCDGYGKPDLSGILQTCLKLRNKTQYNVRASVPLKVPQTLNSQGLFEQRKLHSLDSGANFLVITMMIEKGSLISIVALQ